MEKDYSLPPCCSAPAMTSTIATTATTALLSANPPKAGGPFTSYTFTAVPKGGGAPVTVTCPTPTNCPMKGLAPGTSYDVSVTARASSGTQSPASSPIDLVTPAIGAPAITSAAATGPTQGTSTATPPATGGPWTSYTFTATLIGGGAPVVVTSATPFATFNGLSPGATYDVSVIATGANGPSPASNTLSFTTPSLK